MHKGLHRYAWLLACATFCLIVAGALVTSHDAGLATSDWPLTEGKFLPKVDSLGLSGVNMVGNLYWEHLHRMVASTVGFLTLCLFLYLYRGELRGWFQRLLYFFKLSEQREVAFRGEPRRWLKRLGLVALIG